MTIIKRRLDRSCLPSLCNQEIVDARTLPGEDVEHIAIDVHRPPSYPLQVHRHHASRGQQQWSNTGSDAR